MSWDVWGLRTITSARQHSCRASPCLGPRSFSLRLLAGVLVVGLWKEVEWGQVVPRGTQERMCFYRCGQIAAQGCPPCRSTSTLLRSGPGQGFPCMSVARHAPG